MPAAPLKQAKAIAQAIRHAGHQQNQSELNQNPGLNRTYSALNIRCKPTIQNLSGMSGVFPPN